MRGIDVGPSIDDGDDLCGRQVGQSEIMGCGEGEDVAFAGDRLCSQEQRLEVCSKKGKEVSKRLSVARGNRKEKTIPSPTLSGL